MNTVNELKKLLKLDVEKIRASLLEASTLESLNRQSEALNQLVLSGGGGDTDQEDTDCEIVFEGGRGSAKETGSSASHHQHQKQDGLEISPGVDGTRVKTFEDLVKLKLQQGEQQQQQQQPIQQLRQRNPFKVQSAEKRPFLRRGEGLRRFSKGGGEITSPKDGKKTAASPKTAKSSLERPPQDNTTAIIIEKAPRPKTNVKPKNCEVITESLAGKAQPQLRREDVATEKVTKKRVDFARKVLPISRTLSQQQMTENGITSSSTETAPPSLSTVEVVRQIAHLEKRLLDLMTLKGQLTEERIFELRDTGESDATTDHSATEHLASSIELIRGEIAALNTKVSSLATTGKNGAGGGEEVEEEEEDKNSRHLEDAAEDASRTAATAPSASESAPESCISTTSLSNGDKIAFASDQSITYVHGNGTSQTLYRDGLRVIRFPNGQVERLHPDGSKEITFADGQPVQRRLVIKRKNGGQEDNEEIIHLADGTVHSTTSADGCERIIYPNGDVEWRTEDYTRRHFSSGHIKTQYGNGCSETIFSNGRVRLKDRQGNVLFDRRP